MAPGLDTKLRLQHLTHQVRGATLAPDSIRRAAIPPPPPEGATRPRRDGATRLGAIVTLDGSHRASLTQLLAAMGWNDSAELIATVDGRGAVLRAGRPSRQHPGHLPVRAVCGRITLPPTVVAMLDLAAGAQIVAIALPQIGELRLAAASDALQSLTGTVDVRPQVAQPPSPAETSARRSRVRRAYLHGT